ncbi:hypothetical protein GCM10027596_05790 [Nocardioides korecus]
MGYAALGVAAVVLVGLVVATAHRGRRWWLDRPFMSAYRAAVDELLYVPRARERLLAHLRSAVDRDVVRSPDHQVGGSPPTGGGR